MFREDSKNKWEIYPRSNIHLKSRKLERWMGSGILYGLDLSQTYIRDISLLANAPNLYYLNLEGTKVVDISAVRDKLA